LHKAHEELESAQLDARSKAETIEQLSSEMAGLVTNLASLQQAHATLNEDAMTLRKRLATAESQVASLNDKMDQAEEDYLSQADRTSAIEEELHRVSAENASLLSQLQVSSGMLLSASRNSRCLKTGHWMRMIWDGVMMFAVQQESASLQSKYDELESALHSKSQVRGVFR
jgi:chromosome segregation ATPase